MNHHKSGRSLSKNRTSTTTTSNTTIYRPSTAALPLIKGGDRPFTSGGRIPKGRYEHADSGLAPVIHPGNKLRNYRDRSIKHEALKEYDNMTKGYRWFDEYNSAANNEMFITIEFCSCCYMHLGSTRHNEEKYAMFANTVRRMIINTYPAINVILKPLFVDNDDNSIEGLYLRSRLGAFEVQLCIKNAKGEIKKYMLFSKLQSTLWPNLPKLVEKIKQFIPSEIDPNNPSTLIWNSLPDYVIPPRKTKVRLPLQVREDYLKPRPFTAVPLKPQSRNQKSRVTLTTIPQEKESPVINIVVPEPVIIQEVKKDEVEFSIHNIDNEEVVVGACVILRESKEIELERFTDLDGKCLVPTEKLAKTRLIINHKDYFGMVEEYGGEEGMDPAKVMKDNKKKIYLIPRPADDNDIQFRLLPGNGIKCVEFFVLTSDNELALNGVSVSSGLNGKELITLKNLLQRKGTVFRIVAKILPKRLGEFLSQETTFMISRSNGCEPITIFMPHEEIVYDKSDNPALYWDIGFFADPIANPIFFEINSYSKKEIKHNSYLDEYQHMMTSLGNLNGDLKRLLGYTEANIIDRDGDMFVSKRNIYASIDKFGLRGKNIDHLLSSARATDGVYSYKECERKFGALKPPYNFIPYRKLGSLVSLATDQNDQDQE